MKIVFSDHAKKRRIERKIPRKHVVETIKNPQNKLKSFRNRQLFQKQFNGKILEVVITKQESATIVVTQYWVEEQDENNL